jgi:signal transduction histidine kinase
VNVSFRSKLLGSHAAVALLVAGLTLILVDQVVARRMEEQVDSRLENQARAVAIWLGRAGHPVQLAGRLADVVGARVSFLSQEGEVLGDSRNVPEEARTPELDKARRGEIGWDTRVASWAEQQVRYVAVPGPDNTVVRLGVPIGEITAAKEQIRGLIVIGAVASSMLALILAGIMARALTRRLSKTAEVAKRLGKGDWDISIPAEPDDEIGVLSRALESAAAELKLSDQQRRELLSNIAHEIRTPVTSIRGFAETLASGGLSEEDQREFLQTIHRNSMRIGKLVDDLLELEAIEARTGRALERVPVCLRDVVDQAISTLQVRAEESGATVRNEIDAELLACGDAEAIERISLNLIANALAYGGKGVEVAVRATSKANAVHVCFADTGPGVPEEQVARLFERFYRGGAGRTRDKGGSGLGLAIARQLAQAMGGRLYISSNSSEGLEITLELAREC